MVKGVKSERRREEILKIVSEWGIVAVKELAKELGVSLLTIRRDLATLEKEDLIERIWGGVTLKKLHQGELTFEQRSILNLEEKQAIAKAAITLIKPKDVIALTSGTTVFELAKLIPDIPDIHVVTHGINTAYYLGQRGVRVIVPGGYLRESSLSLVGDKTEAFFKDIYIDKCFMGVDGIDIDIGVTALYTAEALVYRAMIEVSKEIIVLADHTKFGKRKLALISPIERINVIITDDGVDPKVLDVFEKRGIKVMIAKVVKSKTTTRVENLSTVSEKGG